MSRDYERTNWRAEKLNTLSDLERMLDNLKEVIAMMKAGYAESHACRQYNVDQMAFRRLLGQENLGYQSSVEEIDLNDPAVRAKLRKSILSWQEELYLDVIGSNDIQDIPPDINETVIEAMKTLPQKEREVLLNRYKEGLTLEETGNIFHVQRERIRQIESKGLRMLRHPSRCSMMRYGKGFLKKWKEYIRIQHEKSISEKMKKIKADIEAALKVNDEQALSGLLKTVLDEHPDVVNRLLETYNANINPRLAITQSYTSVPIEDLDLSVRSYNVLKRGRVKTVGDLSKLSVDQLKGFRNMGRKSLNEILTKMEAMNIYICGSEKELQVYQNTRLPKLNAEQEVEPEL